MFPQAPTLIGDAAYAANLAADNYDHVRDPDAMFNRATNDIPPVVGQLRDRPTPPLSPLDQEPAMIVENYRQFVKSRNTKTEDHTLWRIY